MAPDLAALPLVDFGRLKDPGTRHDELIKLRQALFEIGFLYLVNTGIADTLQEVHATLPALFALSTAKKEEVAMLNSPAFLGYTRLGAETTAGDTDAREQFDFGTATKATWKEGDPTWQRMEAPSKYPDLPGFQDLIERYLAEVTELSDSFLQFVGESLSLPPDTLKPFLGSMHRLKLVKYPPATPGSTGVGPHKDSTGLFTFLSQDSVGGLQVLSKAGAWIDAPPIDGSLVVNVQQGFEAITGGICPATTHRVLSPVNTTRYSIPFFQGVNLNLSLEDLQLSARDIVSKIPISKDVGKGDVRRQDVYVPSEFLSPLYSCLGEAQFRNRIISHADVGRKWYPELYAMYSLQRLE